MPGHILFADNDPEFLNTRAEFLERAGYKVFKTTTLSEAEWLLKNANIHLAILDIRMQNDDDDRDESGLTLAKQAAYHLVPKIILTGHESADAVRDALKRQFGGFIPAIDFIYKKEGPNALIIAINNAFAHHICINWDLVFDWKARDSFGLVNLIEPGLVGEHLLNRAEEFEDLFRRLFYEKDHIRIERLLWQRDSRFALLVFAFNEGMKPESFVVVCGQNVILNEEMQRFEEFAPKASGETGTTLGEKMRAATTHYAANAYVLANNDLENIQTLAELYRSGPEKTFNAALRTLYQETLKAWHQEKPIRKKGAILDALYRERLRLMTNNLSQQYFEERISAIEAQCPTIGIRIERAEKTLTIHFNGLSFTHPDPSPYLSQSIGTPQSALMITVPGILSGDNIITDISGHTWLTDFAEAGLAPLFWNYVTLEAAIRFDWLETKDLQRRYELEKCLIAADFVRPDTRDLEPVVRKPVHAIQNIRRLAYRTVGSDTLAYHQGIYFHAARRLADFNPSYPITSTELARLGQIIFSMALIIQKIRGEGGEGSSAVPILRSAEIRIADRKARIVMIGSRKRQLAPRPYHVFEYLFNHANELCTKEELLEYALKGGYEERYLQTLISRVRKAIEDNPDQPRYLLTELNAGYRLKLKPE